MPNEDGIVPLPYKDAFSRLCIQHIDLLVVLFCMNICIIMTLFGRYLSSVNYLDSIPPKKVYEMLERVYPYPNIIAKAVCIMFLKH